MESYGNDGRSRSLPLASSIHLHYLYSVDDLSSFSLAYSFGVLTHRDLGHRTYRSGCALSILHVKNWKIGPKKCFLFVFLFLQMCPWWLLAAEAWWKSTEVCVLLPWLLRVAWMSCLGVVHVPLTSVNTGAETQAESSLPLMLLLLWPPPVSGSACALETQRRTDTEGREGAISDRRVASPEPGLQKKKKFE